MDLITAKDIYNNPKSHSKEALKECLQILNEDMQPVQINDIQFVALSDAIQRISLLSKEGKRWLEEGKEKILSP